MMTEIEAIEKIREQICNEKGVQRYCRDNCIHGTEYCAYSMAIKALEKQVAKKVAYQGEHEKCPTCGSFHVFGRHCTECGQAIDYE